MTQWMVFARIETEGGGVDERQLLVGDAREAARRWHELRSIGVEVLMQRRRNGRLRRWGWNDHAWQVGRTWRQDVAALPAEEVAVGDLVVAARNLPLKMQTTQLDLAAALAATEINAVGKRCIDDCGPMPPHVQWRCAIHGPVLARLRAVGIGLARVGIGPLVLELAEIERLDTFDGCP